MTVRIFTDRSRIITRERCSRRRWYEYHENGTGIAPRRKSLALAVGGAVHSGLAKLLEHGQDLLDIDATPGDWSVLEEAAVAAALADLRSHSALELESTEREAMRPTAEALTFQQQMLAQARELGMDAAQVGALGTDPTVAQGEFERYLWAEQSALVEGMVRAYARRRLRPLLEQFEVLEVEREGEWKMAEWEVGRSRLVGMMQCTRTATNDEAAIRLAGAPCGWRGKETEVANAGAHPRDWRCPQCGRTLCGIDEPNMVELWFMSRPDALLRERRTNELYLLSYKTTGSWDVRKARDIEHDMQGLSEGVEVERRLGEWWRELRALSGSNEHTEIFLKNEGISLAMQDFLVHAAAPPRIHAIRYEHLLKGYRAEDRELSARLGVTVWTQRSHLVRQYVATSVPKKGEGGYRVGDVCWSWEFYRPEDDKDSKLAWQNWKSRAAWEHGTIRAWIDQLEQSEMLMSGQDSTVGMEPRPLGYRSAAQAMGVTREHPLDAVFVPPVVVYRNDDDLRDWYDQTAAEERRAAEGVAAMNAVADAGERRHLLNVHFPMVRSACEYPGRCAFVGVCYGGPEAKGSPMSTGQFVARVANHPQETQAVAATDSETTR